MGKFLDYSPIKKRLRPGFYIMMTVLCYCVYGLLQYKISPVRVYLMHNMNIDEAAAGYLTSAIDLLQIFTVIPFGVLMKKIGPRKMGFIAFGIEFLGSFLGTFFTSNYTMLFISQLIVGLGGSAVAVIGPYIIILMFKPELRGTANGWYVVAGTGCQFIMYNVVPRIVTPTNLTPAWWLTNLFCIFMLVMWWLFITNEVAPPSNETFNEGETETIGKTLATLKDPKVLQYFIGSAAFMCTGIAGLAFTPTYMTVVRGYDVAMAGTVSSTVSIVGVIAAVVFGTMADKIHSVKKVYAGITIWIIISRILLVIVPDGWMVVFICASQGVACACMGLLFASAATVIDKKEYAMASSAITTGCRVGSFFAASLMGLAVVNFGWTWAFIGSAFISLFAFIGPCTAKGAK
ncbi:MAG: MFS transporter [Mogibacterium sp.]|nr:MFS transporter [Mogibacterium sp.]